MTPLNPMTMMRRDTSKIGFDETAGAAERDRAAGFRIPRRAKLLNYMTGESFLTSLF